MFHELPKCLIFIYIRVIVVQLHRFKIRLFMQRFVLLSILHCVYKDLYDCPTCIVYPSTSSVQKDL